MNSIVRPVNSALTVFFVPCTLKSCDFTVHAQEKKKKKGENVKRGRNFQLKPNDLIVLLNNFLLDMFLNKLTNDLHDLFMTLYA